MLSRGWIVAGLMVSGLALGTQGHLDGAVSAWALALISAALVGALQQTLP